MPIDGSDTLGLLRVAGPALTLFDLDMLAWLTERWREGGRNPLGGITFTLGELGRDLYGRKPAGAERTAIRASINRLYEADFELEGYDCAAARMGVLRSTGAGGRIRLLGSMSWAGAGSGDSHRVGLDWWLVEQLQAGYLTYLDWRILRDLDGLAKRLWVYLESQSFKRHALGEGAVALQLAPPMWAALGVNTRHAPHARRLLAGAGKRIASVDKSFAGFELRKPLRRGGTWTFVARRQLVTRRVASKT